MKTIGKCVYCGDPLYDFQDTIKVKGKGKYHKGCLDIEKTEKG